MPEESGTRYDFHSERACISPVAVICSSARRLGLYSRFVENIYLYGERLHTVARGFLPFALHIVLYIVIVFSSRRSVIIAEIVAVHNYRAIRHQLEPECTLGKAERIKVFAVHYARKLIRYGAGFFRHVSFSGGTTLYADADEFIEKNAKEFVAPESVAIFTDEENGGTVYLQEDGTVLIYSGYSQAASGTWANDKAGNMTVTVAGTPITVTVDTAADTATFAYEYAIYGDYKINFTFTAKYSVIPDFSAVVQENVYNGTYGGQMPMTITLTIVDDTKATLVATVMQGYAPSFDCTYVLEDGVITLTCDVVDKNSKMVWDNLAHSWQLNDEDHSMTAVVEEA